MKGVIYLKRASTNVPVHFHKQKRRERRILKAERKKKKSIARGEKKSLRKQGKQSSVKT